MSISPAATRWCAPGAERWRPQPCPFTGSPDEAPAPTPGHIHQPRLQPLCRMAAAPYPAYNDCCLRDSQDEAPAPTPGHIHRPGLQPLRRMAATPYPAYNDWRPQPCPFTNSPDEAPAPTPGHIHLPRLQPYAGWRLRLIRPTTAKLRFLRRRHQRYFPASGWVSNAAITAASAASLKPCFGSSTPSPKRVCSVS